MGINQDTRSTGAQTPQHNTPEAETFGADRVGEILGRWQAAELKIARGFAECRGLNAPQLEDIYQETALALYGRPFTSEEHLRNALRVGIKHRALRLHRDERRHQQILARHTPGLRIIAEAKNRDMSPEQAALADADRLIAAEFLTELTENERQIFSWLVEGLQYRAVASLLGIPVNEARKAARACARKRERFQLLYDTGRLCGYRAQTIQALQHGQTPSQELAARAFAHLESCASCRLEHKTNATRLRQAFREQAAALLPPVVGGRLGWITRLGERARTLLHRLGIDTASIGQGGLRERAVALAAGGGASAKLAVGVATLSVLAGGALSMHINGTPQAKRRQPTHSPSPAAAVGRRAANATSVTASLEASSLGPSSSRLGGQLDTNVDPAASAGNRKKESSVQHEPNGFTYLGVRRPITAPAVARSEGQHGGGPFSP